MKKQVLVNVSGATTVLITGALYSFWITRLLGVEGKGVFSYMNAISAVLMLLGFRGHDAAFYFAVANSDSKGDSFYSYASYLLKDIIVTTGILLTLYMTVYFTMLDKSIFHLTALAVVINVPVLMLFHIISRFLLANSRFVEYYTANLLKTALNILLIWPLVQFSEIEILTICMFTLPISGFLISIILIFRVSGSFSRDAKRVIFNQTDFTRFSRNAFVGNSASVGNEYTDQLLVGTFLSFRDLGVYSVAYNASKLLYKPLASVFNIVYNRIGREKNKFEISYKFHRFIFWIWFAAYFCLSYFAENFIVLLFGESFRPAAALVPYLGFGLLFFHITRRFTQTILLAFGDARSSSRIQLFNLVMSAVLYVLFAPLFGLYGVTLATMIGLVASSIYSVILLRRRKTLVVARLFF